MRRGLISWSKKEVPEAVLEARVARLQSAMGQEGLDAVLAYTSLAQPAAVSWLTHFVPYWNEALLAVFPSGAPVLLVSFNKRVHPWIREVCRVGEIIAAPNLGRAAAALLSERLANTARIGMIELDALPWPVGEPIIKARANLVDASLLFARIRQPADQAETALAQRACDIASAAFAAIAPGARQASEAIAALEHTARLAGAEEVLICVAPDLAKDSVPRRIEGDAALGGRYAMAVSLAYKGVWLRTARSIASGEPPRSWQRARQWLERSVERMRAGPDGQFATDSAPGGIGAWTIESCLGGSPLAVLAHGGAPAPSGRQTAAANDEPTPGSGSLCAGMLVNVSVRLDLEDGPWLGSACAVLGRRGDDARRLGTY